MFKWLTEIPYPEHKQRSHNSIGSGIDMITMTTTVHYTRTAQQCWVIINLH